MSIFSRLTNIFGHRSLTNKRIKARRIKKSVVLQDHLKMMAMHKRALRNNKRLATWTGVRT